MSELAASYAHCERVARRSASNFYYSFLLLPRRRRRAMCALYAFLRRTDDLGDMPAPVDDRRAALAAWRASLQRATRGAFDDRLLPALADTVTSFHIPLDYLHAVIDGVEMDLAPRGFATFVELENYCYHVAAVVGLACLHIWGCHDPAAHGPARQCGLAFQMTNILRDLKEDAQAGRVYLPQEDLARFGYGGDELRSGIPDERFRRLMRFEIARTESFYAEAAALADWLEPAARRMLGSMITVYRALLDEIKRLDGDVLSRRVRLSHWRKMRIAARWLLSNAQAPITAPGAGTP